jgi:predicted 3-demethylubiquinone-9 3-methyltransferase (glyoxalase superfamily)
LPADPVFIDRPDTQGATMQKISPAPVVHRQGGGAARFYVSIFPDSRMDRVATSPAETPSGPPGSVTMVDFTFCGQQFMAISACPLDALNHAVSFVVN